MARFNKRYLRDSEIIEILNDDEPVSDSSSEYNNEESSESHSNSDTSKESDGSLNESDSDNEVRPTIDTVWKMYRNRHRDFLKYDYPETRRYVPPQTGLKPDKPFHFFILFFTGTFFAQLAADCV